MDFPDFTRDLKASKISASLKSGASVALGDKIGVTGCTGRCSGEHLHLQIKDTLQKGPNSYSPGPDYNQKGWLP